MNAVWQPLALCQRQCAADALSSWTMLQCHSSYAVILAQLAGLDQTAMTCPESSSMAAAGTGSVLHILVATISTFVLHVAVTWATSGRQ